MMLSDDEIMAQVRAVFQAEEAEHRQAIGELLLELERRPRHPQRAELLDQLFREAHSLKGGARAAGLDVIEELAHGIENIFSAVRRNQRDLEAELYDGIHAALEAIGLAMQQAASGQHVTPAHYSLVLDTLARLVSGAPEAPPAPAVAPETGDQETAEHEDPERLPRSQSGRQTTVRLPVSVLDALLSETGELTICSLRGRQRSGEAGRLLERVGRWRHTWRQVRPAYSALEQRAQTIRPLVHYLPDRGDQMPAAPVVDRAAQQTQQLLSALAQANQLIEELQQALGQHAAQLSEDSARLASVSDRLQAQVRRTRMLPLTTLFGPLRVQVREMLRLVGKQVVLELDDGGAEADRQVLEQLREVLLHLLRNALDHGIEPAEIRIANGKSAVGRLALRAQIEGDRLVIQLEDDGAGLDLQAIRGEAQARGLEDQTALSRMDDGEIAALIFQPGFSTRHTVSALSGRGVGLDAVRAQVERIHGRVMVNSQPGAGCCFTISVPLSLATSQGLLVRAGSASFALPLDSVLRILEVTPRQAQMVEGRPTLALDGRPVPLAALADLLGQSRASRQTSGLALLMERGDRQVACLIDDVLGEQELVVHRLPAPLVRLRYIAGATIMPDGSVIPLLDPVSLVRAALHSPAPAQLAADDQQGRLPERRPVVLVVDDSLTTRTLEKNILEAAGYRVYLAANGVEALARLSGLMAEEACDLLLSDIDMPQMNGFELTARIRSDPALKHLPVVLVTSLDTAADRERGIAAGADAYITKQRFDQRTLLEMIEQLV